MKDWRQSNWQRERQFEVSCTVHGDKAKVVFPGEVAAVYRTLSMQCSLGLLDVLSGKSRLLK